jgi:hypothetical protein
VGTRVQFPAFIKPWAYVVPAPRKDKERGGGRHRDDTRDHEYRTAGDDYREDGGEGGDGDGDWDMPDVPEAAGQAAGWVPWALSGLGLAPPAEPAWPKWPCPRPRSCQEVLVVALWIV